ncbi:MAG: trypsin-like peptidase domain-containing protein [Nitrospirota bacterium]
MSKTLSESDGKIGRDQDVGKFALVHLSGSWRGLTQEFTVNRVRIGTDPANDLAFDPLRDSAVSQFHAEITVENCEIVLRHKGNQSSTFVNHQCVTEIILQDNDLLRFGVGGPQTRIRIRPEAYASCKPVWDIFCDCRDIAGAAQRGWVVGAALFFRHLLSDLVFHATVPIRLLAGTLVLLPFALVLGLFFYQYQARQADERQIRGLLEQIETSRVSQRELEKRVQEERQRATELLDEQKKQADTLTAFVRRKEKEMGTEAEVSALKQQLRAVESGHVAAERIIRAYGGSVAFLQGTFGFVEKSSSRPLRFQGVHPNGEPFRDADGRPLFTFGGETPPATVSFTGTGFLVHARGMLMTNRHLAHPWEMDPATRQLIGPDLEPRLLRFRAFFPGVPAPFDLTVVSVSEQADLALLRFDPGGLKLPALRLAPQATGVTVGESILVLGYPTGFDALLARADPATSSDIMQRAGTDADRLAQDLAEHKLIRPLATQGHVGDLLPDRLLYDAQTTQGGSGGPVFNLRGEVIAVNSMILRRFGGANIGVPVQFGIELLKRNQRSN